MKATLATVCLLAGSVSLAQAQFSGRPQFGPSTNDPFQHTQEQYRIPTHVAPPSPFPKGHPLGIQERNGRIVDPVQEMMRIPQIQPPRAESEMPASSAPPSANIPPVHVPHIHVPHVHIKPTGAKPNWTALAVKGILGAVVAGLVSCGGGLLRSRRSGQK